LAWLHLKSERIAYKYHDAFANISKYFMSWTYEMGELNNMQETLCSNRSKTLLKTHSA